MFQVTATREFLESRSPQQLLEWLSTHRELLTFLQGIKPSGVQAQAQPQGPGQGQGQGPGQTTMQAQKVLCDLVLQKTEPYSYDVHIRFRATTAPQIGDSVAAGSDGSDVGDEKVPATGNEG